MPRPPRLAQICRLSAVVAVAFAIAAGAAGCDSAYPSAAYPAPTLLSPDRDQAVAPGAVSYEWQLPDGATRSDYAELRLDGYFDASRHQILFDTLRAFSGGTDAGAGRQSNGVVLLEADADAFIGYRVRAVGPAGEGAWSPVQTIRVRALSAMRAVRFDVPVEFDLTPSTSGGYYSGSETSAPVDLAAAVRAAGLDPARILAIKPVGGTVQYTGPPGGDQDFTRVTVGFVDRAGGGPDDLTDPLGDTYGVAPGATLTLYPYGARYRNLASLVARPRRLQLLYALRPGAPVGAPRPLRVVLTMDGYAD